MPSAGQRGLSPSTDELDLNKLKMTSVNSNKKQNSSRKREKVKLYPQKTSLKDAESKEINELVKSYQEVNLEDIQKFTDIPLSQKTQKGLKKAGYFKPTEIQKGSILLSLKGQDVLGAAKTGSGKTVAFLVPVLEKLFRERWTPFDGVGALIITPTRELAYQIFEVLKNIGSCHDFSAGLIIGGKDLKFERERMDKCNVIICTPGRILQHMDENPLFDCTNLQILVLDEADRVLDLGFEKTLNAIIDNLPSRQTLLFSATQTKSVKDLARLSLKDPEYVSVHEHSQYSTPESLKQIYVVCELQDKIDMLWSFLKSHKKQKILIFLSSCKQVKYAFEVFCRLRPGSTVLSLYGSLHQLRRMAIYDEFCRKESAILIATDLAARGLDFPSVHWVVQLDCPEDVNTYIHRVGRTARFEKDGQSLLVLLPSEESSMIQNLEEKKIPISKIHINSIRIISVTRKMEAICARDVNLKQSAQRAFVAYVKSIFLMKDKAIFDISKLDTDAYARSLGLAIPPRIRFLKKQEKIRAKQLEKSVKSTADESDSDAETVTTSKPFNNSTNYEFYNEDSDEDVDSFLVKKHSTNDDKDNPEEDQEEDELLGLSNKAQKKMLKPQTRASLAKKVLKKNITANTKVFFDDEGEVKEDCPTDMKSEAAHQLRQKMEEKLKESGVTGGGIDIEIAKEIMLEEDKIDKKLFNRRIKAVHKEQKKKLKAQRLLEKGEDPKADEVKAYDGSSDDDDEVNDSLIDTLPDPDKIYGVSETREPVDVIETPPQSKVERKKRKKLDRRIDRKKKKLETFNAVEDLALQLLS